VSDSKAITELWVGQTPCLGCLQTHFVGSGLKAQYLDPHLLHTAFLDLNHQQDATSHKNRQRLTRPYDRFSEESSGH
jgi:hypothetical protein